MGADEVIAVEQALKSLIIMSAWQIGFENELGSIKTCKYTDFVILDRRPLDVPVDKIREIRVLQDYCERQ